MPSRVAVMRPRVAEFLRFCAAGGCGFLVDAAVLTFEVRVLGIDPIVARFASFSVAVMTTFEFNRRWAFGRRGGRRYLASLAGYLGVQGFGFACNFALYALGYLVLPPPYDAPLVCLVIGSGAGLLVNYFGASLLVFRPHRPSDIRVTAPPDQRDSDVHV